MKARSAKRVRYHLKESAASRRARSLQLRTAPAMLNQKAGPMKDRRGQLRREAERKDEQ